MVESVIITAQYEKSIKNKYLNVTLLLLCAVPLSAAGFSAPQTHFSVMADFSKVVIKRPPG